MFKVTYPSALLVTLTFLAAAPSGRAELVLNEAGYFERPGLNVMVFDDYYPEGHQGGVAFIQNGRRVATNGDLRLGPDPGQWQPVPEKLERTVDADDGTIRVSLAFPDASKHLQGFNPMAYPPMELDYAVSVHVEGDAVVVTVDLEAPVPDAYVGKVGFNLELFPGAYFGKSYYMDDTSGHFPQQANGPVVRDGAGRIQVTPLASGRQLSIAPEDDALRFQVESLTGELVLLDGRANHNNGWFVLREVVPAGATKAAVRWHIVPHAIEDWRSPPVIQVSQVGYRTDQVKRAVIELDKRSLLEEWVTLYRLGHDGELTHVKSAPAVPWGTFLRYNYVVFDFSEVTDPGLYVVEYGDDRTGPIRISKDIYERHVWQPTVEYFLPVQMCHMRISEKYRVWHDTCHLDDALMAPLNINHFDGYKQGPSTLCDFEPLEHVPGLNSGGWHDAGDYDLRVESQINTVYMLALAWEAFRPEIDQTLIDQERRIVEVHHPDGVPDILQQIEHGLLTVLGGYDALGRLYRGIITPTLRQYVLLGDAASMSDNEIYRGSREAADLDGVWYHKMANRQSMFFDPQMEEDRVEVVAEALDDRLVFTEENPMRNLDAIAGLATAARVMTEYDPVLAERCLEVAEALWRRYGDVPADPENASEVRWMTMRRTRALAELIRTTGKQAYIDYYITHLDEITADFLHSGASAGMVLPYIEDPVVRQRLRQAALVLRDEIEEMKASTPYEVPYEPRIWGAGWLIQRYGVQQYFLNQAWPDIFPEENMLHALNFILGCHPGSNTASFASGVGAESVLVAYGVNRADWSYTPGGVVSGTALIRPDFPELLEWPFLWQQTEYVLGGGATNFMFLALAAENMASEK